LQVGKERKGGKNGPDYYDWKEEVQLRAFWGGTFHSAKRREKGRWDKEKKKRCLRRWEEKGEKKTSHRAPKKRGIEG